MKAISEEYTRLNEIAHSKPIGLTSRDIVLASIYIFGYKIMKYSRNRITSEE